MIGRFFTDEDLAVAEREWSAGSMPHHLVRELQRVYAEIEEPILMEANPPLVTLRAQVSEVGGDNPEVVLECDPLGPLNDPFCSGTLRVPMPAAQALGQALYRTVEIDVRIVPREPTPAKQVLTEAVARVAGGER